MAFQKKVRDVYLSVSESDERLVVADCSDRNGTMLPPSAIFDIIIKIINERKLI
jgi:hypothetical protein